MGAFAGAVTAARDPEAREEKKEMSTRELLALAFVCSDLSSGKHDEQNCLVAGTISGVIFLARVFAYFLWFFSFHCFVMTPATLPRTTNGSEIN